MGAFKKHHFGPSRSDSDWRAAKALKNFAGFIFVCSRSTIPDQDRGIFGLPGYYEECVRNIHRGMPLFLFNRSNRCLYGVFEAASDGGYNIDPYAWEDTEHSSKSWRYANRVSKLPAQVRVSIRAQRPPLEEESFRPILEYDEGTKFRLELTASQVEHLLRLFDAGQAAKREFCVERNRVKRHVNHDPESPRSTTKSDSDSYSDSSSRGLNSCEDEWTDEAACENVHYQHGGTERAVGERLHQIALDECQPYGKGHLIPAALEDRVGAGYYNDEKMAWKRPSQNPALCSGSDPDNAMLLRLQETDPAVNSNSNHCIQTGVDQSLALSRQDDVVTMPMILSSQMQFPFACSDNMIFIPVRKVPGQQRESATFQGQSQRLKCGDQKRYARGGSMNSRKQGFNQDRIHKSKDARYQNQQTLPENVTLQSQKSQFNQLLVPLCSQGPCQAQQETAQPAAPLSALIMPPSSEGLGFAQQQTPVRVEECAQGFGVANNVQVTPEELQHFLQNGHFPSFLMPRPTAGPQPLTAGFVEALHFEVLQFARWTRPSSEIRFHVEAAIDCVRKGVKMVWPEADVEVFGSFATGLCLQHSDVDLVVIDAPPIPSAEGLSIAQASASLIRELAGALRTYEWCESIKPLDTASMPVLKCLCRPFGISANTPTAISSIAVDITIGGMRNSYFSWNPTAQVLDTSDQVPTPGKFITRHTGGAAREYVFHKIQELPALAPLVLLLKSFLHHKNLSNVYSGGLGSFSLTLLVAFYLEKVAVTREIFSNRSCGDSPTSHTSSPASCSSDLSDDSDAPSRSCSFGALNWNGGSDYSGHSLGECYVRRAADAIERVLSLWDQDGSPYLGTLLLGFLQTFGFQLDLSREKIVLKGIDGSPGGFFRRDDRHVALWIDDPLRPGVNIGAGSFGMVHVQTAFKEMMQALTKCSMFIPPLQCDDKDCQDLAAISQLAHIGCIVVATDDF